MNTLRCSCGRVLSVAHVAQGLRVRCPTCDATHIVPPLEQRTAIPSEAASGDGASLGAGWLAAVIIVPLAVIGTAAFIILRPRNATPSSVAVIAVQPKPSNASDALADASQASHPATVPAKT